MSDTAARLLSLLSLLTSRPAWSGPEPAERLGVSDRTVRNDDEAVALAVGLRAATRVTGVEDTSRRALTKLEQVLPQRLRAEVAALEGGITVAPEDTGTDAPDPVVDPEVLTALATAVRAPEVVRAVVLGPDDEEEVRLEPYRLVTWQRRWYLVGREVPTGGWRVLRADRLRLHPPTHRRFAPAPLAEGEYADLVLRQAASSGWAVHARIRVAAPAAEVAGRLNAAVGVVEEVDERSSVLVTGADSYATVAAYIGMLGLDFEVSGPDELVTRVRELAGRYQRATAP